LNTKTGHFKSGLVIVKENESTKTDKYLINNVDGGILRTRN